MKKVLFLTLATVGLSQAVDIYSAADLKAAEDKLAQKGAPFASQELARYGNHYTMLAHREETGSSEVHEHEADIFVVQDGAATIVTGGKVVNPKTQKSGEIRGSSITGGERHALSTGDIIHIPAGTPHQLLIEKGKPFTYFVVKVTGQ
ncbi:MAG: cupin domain-containing protein [Acidobacteriaceae bacterium]|nr:cupin domain-containing protein [Acidobacteriaceae bacterium]MBV9038279.1 cupin domain-containing protein [Acidobacteriaceae bacterium]MBV9224250.1 cupin domain-containing protein [Acidobacteriaceae bacterium]